MISSEVLDHLTAKIAEAIQVEEASYDEKKLTKS